MRDDRAIQRRDAGHQDGGHQLAQLLVAGIVVLGQPRLQPVGVDEAADRQRAVGQLQRGQEGAVAAHDA
ncbi:MAG: hypothetical protein R2736_12270 [Solirubrobacterales bacterium]